MLVNLLCMINESKASLVLICTRYKGRVVNFWSKKDSKISGFDDQLDVLGGKGGLK